MAIAMSAAILAPSAAATLPEVTTESATEVGATHATLNGTLYTAGYKTEYVFIYGAKLYDNNTPLEESVGVKSTFPVSATVTDLKPETTYHVILAARLAPSGEIIEGGEVTFKTTAYHPAEFAAGLYPGNVEGEQTGKNLFTFQGKPVTCGSNELGDSVSAGTQDLSLTATYTECTNAFGKATVTMNSCHYAADLVDAGPPFLGSFAIACEEEEDAIVVSASGCLLSIPAQSPSGMLSYENTGSGSTASVDVEGSATGVEYTAKGLCPLIGISLGEHEDGVLDPTMSLGASHSGESTSFSVDSDLPDTGLFVEGEESGEEANQPHFEAAETPATVHGERTEAEAFSFEEVPFDCGAAVLAGDMSGSSSLDLNAEYSKCTSIVGSATVAMNSCHYVIGLDNSGPPYTGSLAIACEEEDAIVVSASGCTLTIPAQSPSGTLSYENTGSGSIASVDVEGSATGVEYTAKGLCPFIGISQGEHEDGVLNATTTLGGSYLG